MNGTYNLNDCGSEIWSKLSASVIRLDNVRRTLRVRSTSRQMSDDLCSSAGE